MRYLSIYRSLVHEEGAMPDPEHMQAMGKLIEEMMSKGKLQDTGPLAPRSECLRITLKGDELTVSPETERASGYAFLTADSKEELVELTKKFLKIAGDGVCEIRAIPEF